MGMGGHVRFVVAGGVCTGLIFRVMFVLFTSPIQSGRVGVGSLVLFYMVI